MNKKKILKENFLKKFTISETLKHEITSQERYEVG